MCIKGFLFDMDGVLVDSEQWISRAAICMFEEMGVKVAAEDFSPFIGMGEGRYIGGVAEKYGILMDTEEKKHRTYEIYEQLIVGALTPMPGIDRLIERLRKRGIKIAVATSADERKMRANLNEINLLPESFDAVVTGREVKRKKPFPDIYLEAANRIGIPIEHCMVVEDAVNGVEAAKTAGARCLAITGSFDQVQLAQADFIVSSFTDISDTDLDKMIDRNN